MAASKYIPEAYEAWKMGVGFQRGRIMWKVTFLATIWTIWKERNMQCFEGKSSNEVLLVDKVNFLVASWITPLPRFQDIPIAAILRNWKKVGFSSLAKSCILPR